MSVASASATAVATPISATAVAASISATAVASPSSTTAATIAADGAATHGAATIILFAAGWHGEPS